MRIIRNFSIADIQRLNETLYQIENGRNYDPRDMSSKVLYHVAKILKAVRKNQLDKISYHVCMAFSWAMAIANRLHVDMEKEIWERFPGICPYCVGPTCRCGKKRPKHRKRFQVDHRLRPASCHGYQLMFAKIYPQTLQEAVIHLAEEVAEVDQAIRCHRGTHHEQLYHHIILELADVFSTLFAVATNTKLGKIKAGSLGFDVAEQMERWFGNGCPGCGDSPCRCKYVDTIEELLKESKPSARGTQTLKSKLKK